MSFFFFSFYFSLWPASGSHANAGLACLRCLPLHGHHHHQSSLGPSFPHVAGMGVPHQLLPHQHSPAHQQQLSAAPAVPGMTALAAGDPGAQLHHQQQLAIASLAAAAGGVAAATKKRQRESSEELLLVQKTKHWSTQFPPTLITPIHFIFQKSSPQLINRLYQC